MKTDDSSVTLFPSAAGQLLEATNLVAGGKDTALKIPGSR
jgi:hypothetical protein